MTDKKQNLSRPFHEDNRRRLLERLRAKRADQLAALESARAALESAVGRKLIYIQLPISKLSARGWDRYLKRDLWTCYEAAFILSGYAPPNMGRWPPQCALPNVDWNKLQLELLVVDRDAFHAWTYWRDALTSAGKIWRANNQHPNGLTYIGEPGTAEALHQFVPSDVMKWVKDTKRADGGWPGILRKPSNGKPTDAGGTWEEKARHLAQSIGEKKWDHEGVRQVTARNVCKAVAMELAKDPTTHGTRGPRAAESVRKALNGWRFVPPSSSA
jgi:hypothetical protein